MMVPPRVAQQDESKQALECGAISHVISVTSFAGDIVTVLLSCRNYECNEERSRAILPVRCISLRNPGCRRKERKERRGSVDHRCGLACHRNCSPPGWSRLVSGWGGRSCPLALRQCTCLGGPLGMTGTRGGAHR